MTDIIATQGRLADAKLARLNLILTQGGEPTLVPHDASAPEWSVAALGPTKLSYARRLARELATKLLPGGVILQSFGKQYPGEPLPRWQVGVYRSRAGAPLWTDLDRLRLDQTKLPNPGAKAARTLVADLAAALGLPNTAVPAYEDFEEKLKVTEGADAARLLPRFSREKRAFVSTPLSEAESARWSAFLEPAGWVLPLTHEEHRWRTDEWKLADAEDLILIPGDSPIGLRLPLHRLSDDALRRGLTVENKNGELVVFLPPLPSFAAFASLVRTIETLATKLDLPPLRLEGYVPPGDDDLESIALTSDPGVLEVNLPPADNWQQFDRVIRTLFECADNVGLRGYKYQLSGRKVSTGGGAHIVLGGPDLARNPFIARPTMISSFLRFLQNHPSLSYAFSGLFTGPSSQAPRVDESAFALPYELETSLRAVESMEQPGDPVMIDAMLRNLLMDWNGNTHRAELSVDKFYNYNAPNGQNGLIELRAFEMVPEPEPLLAANVLVRVLAACFAEEPFTHPLIDWREALHDRFALPHFLRRDLENVIAYVNGHGFEFATEVFDRQLAFRFPVIARFETGDVRWTLRQALELWPVMGEHEGTGRVVDSTTDRLELLAEGPVNSAALAVGVNGSRMPLVQSDGCAVGGIRYRLFDNPWGLQPQIRAHSPLRLQIVDPATRTVLYALDYLNWKRDGLEYDGPPETAAEAGSRVEQRVVKRVDDVGTHVDLADAASDPHAPFTLDLRRC